MSASLSTSQSTVQAPSSTVGTSTTTANAANSNAEAQAAAGLTGEAPPTTVEGGLLGALASMGSMGSVVLDAMPLSEAMPYALQLTSMDWVREWLAALPLDELAKCGESVAAAALDALFPVGTSLSGSASAYVSAAAGALEVGGAATLSRKKSGWDFGVQGQVEAAMGPGAEGLVSVTGAGDNEAGVFCGGEVTPGATFEVGWAESAMDVVEAALAAAGASAEERLAAALPGLLEASLQVAPTRWVVGGGIGAGVDVGTADLEVSAESAGMPGIDDGGGTLHLLDESLDQIRAQLSGKVAVKAGYDNGELFAVVTGTLAGAVDNDPETQAEAEVEIRGPIPTEDDPLQTFTASRAVLTLRYGGDDTTEVGVEYGDLGALLAAMVGGEGNPEAVPDLVVGRTHAVEDPDALDAFLPPGVPTVAAGVDLMAAEAGVKWSTEVGIRVIGRNVAAELGEDIRLTEETGLEVSRWVVGELTGEPYAIDLPTPKEIGPMIELDPVSVVCEGKVGVGAGGVADGVGAGAKAEVALKQEFDVTERVADGPMAVVDVYTLLTA